MSEEDRELLARIGQLAGQINRHKNQQASTVPGARPVSYSNNTYRHTHAPYSRGGYRGRVSAAHRHRTLRLNGSLPSPETKSVGNGNAPDSSSTSWVTRNDRHRQLINANVYEKEAQNRAKALEETRQRKLRQRRQNEKMRFKSFLQHQASAPEVSTNPTIHASRNEIVINGLRFRVMDGGKKLVRVKDDLSSATTPKSAIVAGVSFYRTKSGNLVANRVVQDHRRSGRVNKIDALCRTFSTTGSCPKGPSCRFQHDPHKVAVCKDVLKDGKCPNGASCDLSHDLVPERVPNCLHYAKGHCAKPDCVYTHFQGPPSAPVCASFGFRGFCEKGSSCDERHVFECPDFSNAGVCKNKGCKLLHRERASVLRTHANKADEAMDDVSSDDESVDLDDVDSDAVAEFIEADSDDSDHESPSEFLPI